MFNTEHAYPTELTKFLPNVCTEPPKGENAFCKNHSATAAKLGIPAKLSDFLTYCGANPQSYNIEGKSKVASVLKKMADTAGKSCTIDDTQNTSYLLRNRTIANQTNLSADESIEPGCNKDLGEKSAHKLTRSHGIFAGIAGGGIIRNWAPLYKSEGTPQVFSLNFQKENVICMCCSLAGRVDYNKYCSESSIS